MDKRLAVILGCLALYGCAAKHPSFIASPMDCDGSGVCEVNIINPECISTSCTADVDRDPVKFVKGRNNIVIKWILPHGFGFCTARGDGVFLKGEDPDDQFEDPRGEGNGPGVCKRVRYVMTAKNTVPDRRFPYLIKFHSANGKSPLYLIDPVMFNE